jgi:hypothetical protein
MIWQNPWAWAGLGFLVLPVLIHLLGRGQASRRVFPTLRFLPPSRSLPTKRRRIRDPLLLAVRLGILASAVIALAQPFLFTRKRSNALSRGIARAIIVDTSESMHRAAPNGARPMDAARTESERLARDAQTSLVIQSATPRRALAGAVAWIARQRRRAELVIVSDFQTGTIDRRDLDAVPRGAGVRFSRVTAAGRSSESVTHTGDVGTIARVTASTTGSTVLWTNTARAVGGRSSILILAGAAERSGAEAAQRAAAALSVRLPVDSSQAVAIVYPGYERRADILKSATPLRAPWMTDVVARLRADSMLIGAASAETASRADAGDSAGKLVVARFAAGKPAVVAVQGQVDGRDHLILLPSVDASSLTSAALIAATTRALSSAAPVSEMEPSTVPDDVLRSWQREPDASAAQGSTDGVSDGRWLWIAALALLGLETWLRRARREEVMSTMVRDRAA